MQYYVNVGVTFSYDVEDEDTAEEMAYKDAKEIYGEHFASEAWYAVEESE